MNRTAEILAGKPWCRPRVYQIRFRGYLSSYHAQMFEGLEMVQGPEGETVLTGPVIDQAALHGILNRIRDLGVPLLSVNLVEQGDMSTEGRDPK